MTWFEESHEIAVTVARKVHRKYHTYFDVSDLSQELSVWLVRRQDKLEEWLDHPLDSDEYKMGVKKLGKTLTRHADKYCRRLKAQKIGYEIRDEQYYPPITLTRLLPFIWSEILETRDSTEPRVSGGGAPAEGGNYIIQLFDIRRAMLQLNEADRKILRLKFYEQVPYRELADVLGCSDTTAHRRVDSALSRLTYMLGGPNPFEKGEE